MDQEITTCPQCGATVHAPARFCVTCGIRLPDTVASTDDGEPVDPRAGWTNRDMSGWTTPPPGAFDFEDPTIIDVEPIPMTTEPPVSRWASWPSQPERTESPAGEATAVESVSSEDDYVMTSTTPALAVEEFEMVTSETATPDPDDLVETEDEPVASIAAEHDAGTEEDTPSEELTSEISPALEEPLMPSETGEETEEPDEGFEIEIGDDLPDDFEPAGWTETEDEAVREPVTPEEVYAATKGNEESDGRDELAALEESDPIIAASGVERANELLDELRALLPGLVREVAAPVATMPEAEEPPAPAIDLESIRAAAVEARGEISFDNFAALRATIDEATTKPRDVEVMLKLSRRVDDIVALLAERDRLQLAFDAMLERLNAESS